MSQDYQHVHTKKADIPVSVQLASTDHLIAELISRSEGLVFAMRYKPEVNSPASLEDFRFSGDPRIAQGMCSGLIRKIEDYLNKVRGHYPEEWER